MSEKNEMLVVEDLGEIKKDVDLLEKELSAHGMLLSSV